MRQKSPKWIAMEIKIGARWKEARRAKHLTAEQVTQHLRENDYNCDRTVIYRLENGKSQPEHYCVIIQLLCRLYGIPPNQIFGARE